METQLSYWQICYRENLEKKRLQNTLKNRRYRLRHPKRLRAIYAKYRNKKKRDKFKDNARIALNLAIKSGKLLRPSKCERCRATCKAHGHHTDYSKPLSVQWLCVKCHAIAHRRIFS